jgi:predicted ester cyclase
MRSAEREIIYLQVIDAISRNDPEALDLFLAEHLIDHNSIPGQSAGRAGFKEWMASARTSFPDLHGRVEAVISAGDDHLVGRVTWLGTQRGPFAGLRPTHKPVTLG